MEKFLYFFKPYFDYIDKGLLFKKPFYWLYTIIAGINLLAPILILGGAISNNIFRLPGKFILAFLLIWLVLLIAFLLGFQLWWNRRDQVTKSSSEGSDFIATPVFAHFIQTMGEYYGSLIAIIFVTFGLFGPIFLGDSMSMLTNSMGLPIPNMGFGLVLIGPIVGFLTIVLTRFLAEQIRALASIANNSADSAKTARIGAKYTKQIFEKS